MLQDGGEPRLIPPQNKLEAQYAAKRQAHENEVQDLKQQLEFKANEIRSLNTSIDGLKSVNEELKVCHLFIRWLAPTGAVADRRSRERLLSPRPELRAARTSRRARRTLNGPERPSASSSRSSMGLRKTSCEICRTVVRR